MHRHCTNGSLKERGIWLQRFPEIMFGFIAVLLQEVRHSKLGEVVETLPMSRILLETDSPYLLAPVHQQEKYNVPYGLVAVAECVAGLKDMPLREVMSASTFNARKLYNIVL